MKFDRVVQVRVTVPHRARSFGSGYLIAPRLVLTAGHVVAKAGHSAAQVRVRCPDAGPDEFAAAVRWSQVDAAVDAALVEVTAHDWEPPGSWQVGGLGQRFGQLVTTAAGLPVTARGFPRLQRDPDGGRFDEQLDGRVSAGTGPLAGRYEVLSTDPLPKPAEDAESQWAGMSGAALFAGDLLLGVIRRDRRPVVGTRLTATRIHDVIAVSQAGELIRADAGRPAVVEPAELADLVEPAVVARDLRSPATLLRADAEVVAFRGRDTERSVLLEWCLRGGRGLSVRVLTGPGGQGKTRLARWLIGTVREHGWSAGQLRADLTDDPSRPVADVRPLESVISPVLVVADYAESRPRLVRRLIEAARGATSPVRLLLVARSVGPWQTDPLSAQAAVHEILAAAPELKLGPLDVTAAGRRAGFNAAALALARLLGQVDGLAGTDWPRLVPALEHPDQLSNVRYQTALSVQMAALVELLQHGPSPVTAGAAEPVEALLLRHEERYWDRTARTHHLDDIPAVLLKRAVAAACLCGAISESQAVTTLTHLPAVTPERGFGMALWLRELYPAPASQYWGSVQPDRVAEYHASTVVTGTPGLLAELLTGATTEQQVQAVTVLARAAVAHANADRPEASTEVLGELDAALQSVNPGLSVLRASHMALPHSSQALAAFTVQLGEDVTALYRQLAASDPDKYDDDLATSLNNLSDDYAELGRRPQALAAAQEALTIRRRLYAIDPEREASDLAGALTLFANACEAAGRYSDGLAAISEAVTITRRLATANPDAFRGDLAASLSLLSTLFGHVGRHPEALPAIKEAVAIRRQLAAADPDAYEYELAQALNNLSVVSVDLGMHAEALAANEEAVEVYRRLSQANPDAYEHSLAVALSNLSNRYADLGRPTEALAAAEEAVTIRHRLAATNPHAHQSHLAESLTNLAGMYQAVRRSPEGLAAAEEAVTLFRELAAADPRAYESDLAAALTNLATRYGDAGRYPEQVATTEEAVAIQRRLVAVNPDGENPNIALSLNNLSIAYADARRGAEALAAAQEAVAIRRSLAAVAPGAYEPGLATSLNVLSVRYGEAGQQAEALAVAEEGLAIWRRLAAASPDAYEPDLAISLHNLAIDYMSAGRPGDSLAAGEEAMAIRRRQAVADPIAGGADLAVALDGLSQRYSEIERWDQSLAAAREAVAIWRRLAAAHPAGYQPDLASSLRHLGSIYMLADRLEESLDATEEAARIWRNLTSGNPEEYQLRIARALRLSAWLRLKLRTGLAAAFDAAREAAAIYCPLMPLADESLATNVELLLTVAADVLDALGQYDTAAALRRLSGDGSLAEGLSFLQTIPVVGPDTDEPSSSNP